MKTLSFASVRILIGLALYAGAAGRAGAQNSVDAGHAVPPAASEQADPTLQTRVTLAMDGQPLRAVLAAVGLQTGVSVRAETNLQEYRVSLHTNAQPLAAVMRRLTQLFQHDDLSVNNYGWTRASEGGKIRYILTRNARAYEQEQAMLDLPRVRRVRWLRDMRDFLRLPADKRTTFRSDNPGLQYHIATGEGFDKDPAAEAVAALTDEQMTALLRDGQVDVPQLMLSPDALAYLQRAVPHGSGVTAGFSDYNPPAQARLTMQDDGKKSAQYRGVSSLTLGFGSGFPRYCPMGHIFNTLGQLPTDAEPPDSDNNTLPQIDLLAHEPVLQKQRRPITLARALGLLARESGLNIYAETFPKPSLSLSRTAGTLEGLLNSLCHTYGCAWRKTGGDYLVYSKAWAQDRAADIPQPTLDRWNDSHARHRRYELQDLIEMACLKEEQLPTLMDITKVQSIQSTNRHALQILALVSPHDIAQAYTPEGVSLDMLDDARLQIARALFQRPNIALPLTIRLNYKITGDPRFLNAGTEIELTDSAGAKADAWAFDYTQ